MSQLLRATHKAIAHLRHRLLILFSHRAPQQIGLAQAEARQHLRNPHYLFLVNRHAQRILQYSLKLRQQKLYLLASPLALDEVVDHVHRPRSEQRIQLRQLFHGIRFVAAQNVSHPRRFELEHARSQRGMKHALESLRVVNRNSLDVKRLATRLRNQLYGIIDHRESCQAQEVHLQQAHLLYGFHVVCGYDLIVLGAVQRHQFRQRAWRNHHRGGVHARAAHQPFELLRGVNQLAHLLVVVVQLAQIGHVLKRSVDRHAHRGRYQLGNAIHVAVGHIERAAAILDRRLGRHGIERDYLRHLLAAVFARHVVDHFAAPVHAEVHVDIRHRHALRIQEPLEEKHVL